MGVFLSDYGRSLPVWKYGGKRPERPNHNVNVGQKIDTRGVVPDKDPSLSDIHIPVHTLINAKFVLLWWGTACMST